MILRRRASVRAAEETKLLSIPHEVERFKMQGGQTKLILKGSWSCRT